MGKKVDVKIIKPPVELVISGKIFKPATAFLHKLWFKVTFAATMIWLSVVLTYLGAIFMGASLDPVKYPSAFQHISIWLPPIGLWTLVINLVWLIPVLVIIPFYVRSIEYSVKAQSGESMPEVYVKRGIFTITRNHVPFRTVTNISSRSGVFDRLFKIGSVHIETAGYSGSNQPGPEEKLEGIVFYEEVRDFILNELRKFRTPYVTGTEVAHPVEEPVPRMEGLDDEILITLREIRDILRASSKRK